MDTAVAATDAAAASAASPNTGTAAAAAGMMSSSSSSSSSTAVDPAAVAHTPAACACSRESQRQVRVLSIDGGGLKGLIPIQALRKLQHSLGEKPIHEAFDFFIGTSTGGIIAVCLGLLQMSLDEIERLYIALGEEVFPVSDGSAGNARRLYSYLWNAAVFPNAAVALERLFKEVLTLKIPGCDATTVRMNFDPRNPRVALVGCRSGPGGVVTPYLFRSYVNPNLPARMAGSDDAIVWHALRATSAAPFYIKPLVVDEQTFVDGGLLHNNPAQVALKELMSMGSNVVALVSLGTGHAAVEIAIHRPGTYSEDLQLIAGQIANSKAQHNELVHFLNIYHQKLVPCFWRFDLPAGGTLDFTDSRRELLHAMIAAARIEFDQPVHAGQFHNAAKALSQPIFTCPKGLCRPFPTVPRLLSTHADLCWVPLRDVPEGERTLVWDNHHVNGTLFTWKSSWKHKISVWRVTPPPGFLALGDVIIKHNVTQDFSWPGDAGGRNNFVLFVRRGSAIAKPLSNFKPVWRDKFSRCIGDCTLWTADPADPNFMTLGLFATPNQAYPERGDVGKEPGLDKYAAIDRRILRLVPHAKAVLFADSSLLPSGSYPPQEMLTLYRFHPALANLFTTAAPQYRVEFA